MNWGGVELISPPPGSSYANGSNETTRSVLYLRPAPVTTARRLAQAYINGKVLTVNARFSMVEAFAVRGDKFVATGKTSEIRKLASPATKVVDLGGRTVIPGFEDSHLHSAGGGPGVDLSRARTLVDVLSAVRSKHWEAGISYVVS